MVLQYRNTFMAMDDDDSEPGPISVLRAHHAAACTPQRPAVHRPPPSHQRPRPRSPNPPPLSRAQSEVVDGLALYMSKYEEEFEPSSTGS